MERHPCYNMEDVRINYSAMKLITDINEKYGIQNEVNEKHIVAYKRGIRNYFKRKDAELERRVIQFDSDSYIELLQLPEEIKTLEIAKAWFDANELLICEPSPYDCTGREFTGSTKFVQRNGRWWVYHVISLDV